MRAIFFLLALASSGQISGQTSEQLETCKVISEAAGSTMKARQDGFKMSDLMGIVGSEKGFGELGKRMVIRAFEEPAYSTERNQQRAVRDFENAIYLECIKSAPKH